MATLTIYETALTGDSKAYAAGSSGGDVFPNDGRTVLHFKNTNAATRAVTINSVKPCDQGSDHDVIVTIAATTGDEIMGPFPPSRFNDASGNVAITYDVNPPTNLTVAAIRIP